jgi:hypothetical protein
MRQITKATEGGDRQPGGISREEENMNEFKYFLKLTERCHRLAMECTDPHTASHLATLGDEFLNKAAQLSAKPAAEGGAHGAPNRRVAAAPWPH